MNKMTNRDMLEIFEGIFDLGKGLTYLLAMASMIKYLLT
jgi:hypothetical protein